MRKKWFISTLALVLMSTLMLTACGTKTNNSAASKNTSGNSSSSSTAATTKKAAPKQKFTFACSGGYKPFNFKQDGKLTGFDVEIGKALAKKMGMIANPVTNPWASIIQGLLAKKYDAILGSMTITPARKKVVNFSDPYYRSGSQVFVAAKNNSIKSVNDLKGKKIGTAKGTTYEKLADKITGKNNVITYAADLTALHDLPTGRLAGVITDQMVGFRVIKEKALNIKPVGEPLTHDDQAIAVRKDETKLLNKLNKALKEIIADGTYDKISKKWFGRSILGKPAQ
jgi:polar amino acid transport system substrate-binding protein